jgi:hypothetical protein
MRSWVILGALRPITPTYLSDCTTPANVDRVENHLSGRCIRLVSASASPFTPVRAGGKESLAEILQCIILQGESPLMTLPLLTFCEPVDFAIMAAGLLRLTLPASVACSKLQHSPDRISRFGG